MHFQVGYDQLPSGMEEARDQAHTREGEMMIRELFVCIEAGPRSEAWIEVRMPLAMFDHFVKGYIAARKVK